VDFLDRFWKNIQISNFMKMCPVGAELFHAGRQQTGGRFEALRRIFHNFAEASNVLLLLLDKTSNNSEDNNSVGI
jgi:hypothetical protein